MSDFDSGNIQDLLPFLASHSVDPKVHGAIAARAVDLEEKSSARLTRVRASRHRVSVGEEGGPVDLIEAIEVHIDFSDGRQWVGEVILDDAALAKVDDER